MNDNERKESETEFESNAARRLRLTGGNEPAAEAEEPVKINKLANFWYHNKVVILLVAAFAVILSIALVQFTGHANPDVSVLYAGPDDITANENQALSRLFETLIPDLNGDGKTYVQLNDMVYMTEAQVTAYEEAHLGEVVDLLANSQMSERFTYEVFSGSAAVCILAEDQYEIVAHAGGFVKLADLFGEEWPDGAIDECGVRFADTKFCKFYEAAAIFPEDAVIALRTLPTTAVLTGKSKAEKEHANGEALFRAILTWDYPEGYAESDG